MTLKQRSCVAAARHSGMLKNRAMVPSSIAYMSKFVVHNSHTLFSMRRKIQINNQHMCIMSWGFSSIGTIFTAIGKDNLCPIEIWKFLESLLYSAVS